MCLLPAGTMPVAGEICCIVFVFKRFMNTKPERYLLVLEQPSKLSLKTLTPFAQDYLYTVAIHVFDDSFLLVRTFLLSLLCYDASASGNLKE